MGWEKRDFSHPQADLLQEQEAGKNRPASFEMTGGGVPAFVSELKLRPPKERETGEVNSPLQGQGRWQNNGRGGRRDIDSLTRTCGRHILSPSEIAKMSNSSQQEMTG
jgi:hypothetical protein